MSPRTIAAPVALVLALSLVHSATPADAASARAPELIASESRIETGVRLTWEVGFLVVNPLGVGLYTDSMFVDIEDLDPGETRAPRTSSESMEFVTQLMPSVSANDTGSFQYQGTATAEHARLTYRLFAHSADKHSFVLRASVEAMPGPVADAYPSRFLTVGGKKLEYVLVPAERDTGAHPGVLLVHGHGSHARKMLRMGQFLSRKGFTVMLASQAGYGLSTGPPDFMGPSTLSGMMAAVDELKRVPGVDSTRIGAWGISRGATVVMELAEHRTDLSAIIGQAGSYDLWATARGTKLHGMKETIEAEAGKDSAGWRERSPAATPERVHGAVLILHGEKDANVPVDQAHRFADALKARGLEIESKFVPNAEHHLPISTANFAAIDFLTRHLKP